MLINGKYYWFDMDGNESPSHFYKRIKKEQREKDWEKGKNIPSIVDTFEVLSIDRNNKENYE